MQSNQPKETMGQKEDEDDEEDDEDVEKSEKKYKSKISLKIRARLK